MKVFNCPECGYALYEPSQQCPCCGKNLEKTREPIRGGIYYRGFEWRSRTTLMGWPLIHVAFGRNQNTGKLRVAKGIIAIGQFGFGYITFAQFGIGFVFGFGQFIASLIAISQFSLGIYLGLGQFATGYIAIGQIAFGIYVLAQVGYGKYVWSTIIKHPEAIRFFGSRLSKLH
ncbi:hypothetical protein JW979_15925 [bacterium]|nr:hypothetical protein [candidate division CSSED10-310 bacterium]